MYFAASWHLHPAKALPGFALLRSTAGQNVVNKFIPGSPASVHWTLQLSADSCFTAADRDLLSLSAKTRIFATQISTYTYATSLIYLIGMHLIVTHLVAMHLIAMHLITMHIIAMHLITI